jgi:DNA-binding GntR family transcriptional regulator
VARVSGVPDYIVAEHRAMLEACERRDSATAVTILDAHLSGAAEHVLANYEKLIERRRAWG